MIGSTISHYKILEKLGEGGMGVVYKAYDTILERDVAIKFLPRQIAVNDEEKKRFKTEAKAAAALNHPNITTVHAIEEVGDDMFIVMEHIQGKELKKLIAEAPPGAIALDDIVRYAGMMASGLQAAHSRGIIHRDIKSSNMMVTSDGQVKIMDFGLAKIPGTAKLTKTGSTVGTAGYMSPEQIRGEDVDPRTDIFSLGIVLYEMVTTQMPFRGDHEAALAYSIVNEDPTPVKGIRPDIPQGLERIIACCLEKERDRRYSSANELVMDLSRVNPDRQVGSARAGTARSDKKYWRRVTGTVAAMVTLGALGFGIWGWLSGRQASIDSIAILPLVNATSDEDTDYLSDGVTAGLINRLSEIGELKVMSRHSVARFKHAGDDPRAAGRQLGVASVLTGLLDVRAGRLLVDVELLDVSDGRQLWGDRFERDRKDILTIEREIVNRITDKLRVKLAGESQTQHTDDKLIDPEAYDLYLRGRYVMLGTSDDGPSRAQEYFRRAIEREPRLAIAYAGLGESYVNQAWLNSKDREVMVPLAKAALKKAMELDASLSEAHVLAGDVALYFDWDWSSAEASYRKAIELNPGSDLAHREYSNYLLIVNRTDEAIAEARRAQVLDPLSVYASHQLGYNFLVAGRLAEAAVEFRKAIDLNPTWVWGNIKIGMTYAFMGDTVRARAAASRADELLVGRLGSPLAQGWLAQIEYMTGNPNRITETLARLERQAQTTYVEPIALADMCYRIGDYDRMFMYLDRAYEARSPVMVYVLLERELIWKNMANDSRYLNMIKRLGYPSQPT